MSIDPCPAHLVYEQVSVLQSPLSVSTVPRLAQAPHAFIWHTVPMKYLRKLNIELVKSEYKNPVQG